jgi:hypothetical protein
MTYTNRRRLFITESGFDFDNHFAGAEIATVGLHRNSSSDAIYVATDDEMDALDNAYGNEHGVTWSEMNDFLTAWVLDETDAHSEEDA